LRLPPAAPPRPGDRARRRAPARLRRLRRLGRVRGRRGASARVVRPRARAAGTLGGEAAAIARAALGYGLAPAALALWEVRGVDDDRRCGLRVLVYEP